MKLTDKAVRQMDELFSLKAEAITLLGMIVSEWETDPSSVQCFDLRMVERAKYVTKRIRKLDTLRGKP